MFDKRKGQGYIEVMVVVAVLLIITLFAIPRYQDLRRDAYRAQIANDSKLVETYTIEHYFYEGDMPIGSKVISDSELKELVDSKRSYLKGDIISSTDIDAIGGKKHILDKEEVLKHVNTKLKGDFIYTNRGVIYVDDKIQLSEIVEDKDNEDTDTPIDDKPTDIPADKPIEAPEDLPKEKPTGGVWDKYDTQIDGNKVTVLGFKDDYKGDKSHIRDLPELEIDGFQVLKINSDSFKDYEFTGQFPTLKNLEEIAEGAFINSKFTGDLNLPNLKVLGKINFDKTTNVSYAGAFENSDFSNLSIPNIESIGDKTFFYGSNIEKLPDMKNIKEIGNFTFLNNKFTGIFPTLDNLEYVGIAAFMNSNFIGELNLPNVKILGKIIYDINSDMFRGGSFRCSNFTNINIPNIEIIGDGCFEGSSNLKQLPDMKNIREIGAYAFRDSTFTGNFPQLDSLEFVGMGAFRNSKFTGYLILPNLTTIGRISLKPNDMYSGAFSNSNFVNIYMPQVEIIGDLTFMNSKSLFQIITPNLKQIGKLAYGYSQF